MTSGRVRGGGPARTAQADEERFRLVFDEAPIGMALVDADGCFIRVNRALCEILGHAPQDLVGASFTDVIHPADAPSNLAALHQLNVGTLTRARGELRCRRRDGSTVHVETNVSVLRELDGRMRHVVQVEDISTRKRLEEEQRFFAELGPVLASSLERDVILYRVAEVCARRLADHCLVVSIDDESGVRVKRLLSRDPSRQALADAIETYRLDPSRPSLVGRAVELQRPILLREPTDEALQAMAQNEDHLRLLRELGMTSSLTIPLIASGQVVGAMALISCGDSRLFDAGDVRWVEELGWRTAIALENARLYRAALKAANARDEVLAVVAHDLRNPLSTIANQAVLLRRRAQPRAGTEAQAGEMIQHAVGRMDRLIKDLLDVSRMEAGRFSVELAEVDATALVRDCVASQSGLAQQAGLEITADIPQDLPPLRADRDRLLQVFENLIGNAIKFAGTGGHIHVGAAAQESHVVFTVQDDGPGVAPEDLRRLFDRFWQGRRARREGAGLGLPIVKGLVEAHGGEITVASDPGQGTTFTFTIARAA